MQYYKIYYVYYLHVLIYQVNLLKEGKDIPQELQTKPESPTDVNASAAELSGSSEDVALREKVCQ